MKYSEEDIQRAIRYLKIKHPERADREGAIKLLDGLSDAAKSIAQSLTELEKEETGPN